MALRDSTDTASPIALFSECSSINNATVRLKDITHKNTDALVLRASLPGRDPSWR